MKLARASRNSKLFIIVIIFLLGFVPLGHFVPIATKKYGSCGTGEKFRFNILTQSNDGDLSDYQDFKGYEFSLKGPAAGESCIGRSPNTAKLYLW